MSQDEYKALKDACDRRGSRNLSEFARTEMLAYLADNPAEENLNKRFTSIEQAIASLETSVSELNNLLREGPYVCPKTTT
ncbi:MAG TPA: hypothetical protein VMU80_19680 [Bryobacteraceae bacterium]|nr:hypothetical protein [Bryobacteraceae bacterium]